MPEPTTIRVEQIEGLPELIREQVRVVLRQEAQPLLQDMEEIRRSPAGILIRLEERVEALEEKIDQRFAAVHQRFEALEEKMDQRFLALEEKMDQRFLAVDQRFLALEEKMDQRFLAMDQRFLALEEKMDQRFLAVDQRFVALKGEMDQRFIAVDQRFDSVDKRFTLLQWTIGLVLIIQILILGKLFFPH